VEPSPSPPRVVTVQKCARVSGKASDLAYVGRTPRHHTFFEMLGNFSFGDYFKAEIIPWSWELITKVLEIPPDKLWVTVFHSDKEARQIWEKTVGLPTDRVLNRDEKDNFWGPPGPTGPCGPCTEIFVDRGLQYACGPDCSMATCECDRYAEIWNLVFMELFQDADGKRSPLEKKNVDTGMGLERITMVLQGVENTFETDLLFPILKKLADMTGHRYHENPETDVALKIVTDHLRLVTFALGDGITPSNEGRGYIIRMILRRAIRYAKTLGMKEPMLFKLVSTIRDLYQETYPELKADYTHIVDSIKAEEKRFLETLDRGSRMLEDMLKKGNISGEEAFKLYDTYGFPLELTLEIAAEQGLTVDEARFETAMAQQRTQARSAREDRAIVADQVYSHILKESGPTPFMGYDALDGEAKILALLHEGKRVEQFGGTNQAFEVILDQTPFYGESGGQVGDSGILYVQTGEKGQTIVVKDTQKVGELYIHHCLFDQGGSIPVGAHVRAEVNADARHRTMRHHSATHLLHAALKKILGEHVAQAGSFVGPDGARFDINFPRAMTYDEVRQAEMLVNKWILENVEREVNVTDVETAKAAGAVAMFGEKYGDRVRVVSFGPYSKELCGGTHVSRLGDIGLFRILSESAIAAGVRRLEYVAGEPALFDMLRTDNQLSEVSQLLNVSPKELTPRLERLLEEKKAQEKQLKQFQEKLALTQLHDLMAQSNANHVLITPVEATSSDTLKFMAETLSQKLSEDLILLGANIEGKAQFVCSVPKPWLDKGIKAGELVKQAALICEGGGGGKPNFAQAGGKLGNKVPEALKAVENGLSKN